MATGIAASAIDLLTFDVKEIQRLLGEGQLRSVELVQLYLNQIQRHDGYLKALISYEPTDYALGFAKTLDEERVNGKIRGPLHGIPIVVKDNIDTHPDMGFRTTAGSLAFIDSWPRKNARLVDLLVQAGVIVIGKANLSELANFKGFNLTSGWSAVGGQTQSAYVRGGVFQGDGKDGHSNPSGSSSGPAVAVSAGYSPFSIGTETDGSLIVPSGRAAIYTMKPTIGLVSQAGIVPISHNFDSAGPMAKTPYDLAILLDVIVEPDKKSSRSYVSDLTGDWSKISVATLDPNEWKLPDCWVRSVPEATEQMNKEIRSAYARIKSLAKSYAGNVPLIKPEAIELNGVDCEGEIMDADFAREIDIYLQSRDGGAVKSLAQLIDFNQKNADRELPPYASNQEQLTEANSKELSQEQYAAYFNHLREFGRHKGIDLILDKYKVDVIMAPADSMLIRFATCSGYPIASLPLSYLDYNGRPFGLSVIARANQERLLLQTQNAWERTFGPRQPPPLLQEKTSSKY